MASEQHSPSASTTTPPQSYESPSPPSTQSSDGGYDTYGTIQSTQPSTTADRSVVVQLPQGTTRPLSPITSNQALASTKYPSEALDENTRLLTDHHAISTEDEHENTDHNPNPTEEILRSHDTLVHDRELYQLHERQLVQEHRNEARNICLFLCSFLCILIVTFIVVIAGLTELHAKHEIPKLHVYTDWPAGGIIPLKYGCNAPNDTAVSFPLTWKDLPPSATSLVILLTNPSAIKKEHIDPVHWFVTDIPITGNGDYSLPANASADSSLMPNGAVQRANAFDKNGAYFPPCAINGTGFYVIYVYAVEASPKIGDFRDAREIMMRFVGEPYAKITGVYRGHASQSALQKKKGKGHKGDAGHGVEKHDTHHNVHHRTAIRPPSRR